MELNWNDFKTAIDSRVLAIQYVVVNQNYWLKAIDSYFSIECIIPTDPTHGDTIDFETNYKGSANAPLSTRVITSLEENDKDLKLIRGKAIVDPDTRQAIVRIRVPGTFGSGDGRHVLGGYGFTADYHVDDFATVRVEDTDRYIAWAVALAMDPEATEPLSDAAIQGAGILPGIGLAFPNYPLVKSYTDDEAPEENRGWFFYPVYIGNNIAIGEVEVTPIGGYAFIPSGFDLVIVYQRPVGVTTGSIRADLDWGKRPL